MSTTPVPVTFAHAYAAAESMDGTTLGALEDRAGLEPDALGRLARHVLDPIGDELTAALPGGIDDAVAKPVGQAVANAFAVGVLLGIDAAREADAEAFDR